MLPRVGSRLGRRTRGVRCKSSYTVRIFTGDRRGAGTSARVHVALRGALASTNVTQVLESGDFKRGTVVTHELSSDVNLGELTELQIGHDNEGDLGVGWYLDRVEVMRSSQDDEATRQQRWVFPANRWLGESDGGAGDSGPPECVLQQDAHSLTRRGTGMRESVRVADVGAAAYPHPDKVEEGERAVVRRGRGHAGEDAYFYAPMLGGDAARAAFMALGISDGVYAWREQGIDAGKFSRALLGVASDAAAQLSACDVVGLDRGELPLRLLRAAEVKVREEKVQGSATACLACVDGEHGVLEVANLGDSGLMVVRGDEVVFRTPEQEHSFGHPYQLGHHDATDASADAQLYRCGLIAGDVLVLGSDGLFDNVSDVDIARLAHRCVPGALKEWGKGSAGGAALLARELAAAAFHNSLDKAKSTPYSLSATEFFNMVYSGGKKDDISVCCAVLAGPDFADARDGSPR